MKQVPVVYFFQTEPKVQYMFFFQGEELNVKNVISQFPFKITTHHVRFKILVQDIEPKTYQLLNIRHAWFDISNPNAKAPVVNDTVYVKLLYLSDISYSRIAKKMIESLSTVQKKDDVPVQLKQQSPTMENKNLNQQSQSPQQQQLPIQQQSIPQQSIQQQSIQQQQPIQQQPIQQQTIQTVQPQQQTQQRNSNRQLSNQSNGTSQSGDLLEAFEKFDFKPKQTQSQPISQADLDFANSMRNQQPSVQRQQVNNSNGDLFEFNGSQFQPTLNVPQDNGFYDFSAAQQQPYQQQQQQQQPQQQQQTMKKDEDLFEFDVMPEKQKNEGLTDKEYVDQRVEKAAEGLQKIWQDENDYNLQRQQAKEETEPKILKWAFKNDVRNNLRLLLSTLNEVLWEGTNWECSIGDLMTEGKVKIKYRMALLIVHPDKQAKASATQRYIAERVFYELNQAWNDEKLRS